MRRNVAPEEGTKHENGNKSGESGKEIKVYI